MVGVQLLHWTIVAADVTAASDVLRVRRDSIHINQLQIARMLRPGCGVAGSRMHNLRSHAARSAAAALSIVKGLPQPSLITVRCVAGVLVDSMHSLTL